MLLRLTCRSYLLLIITVIWIALKLGSLTEHTFMNNNLQSLLSALLEMQSNH